MLRFLVLAAVGSLLVCSPEFVVAQEAILESSVRADDGLWQRVQDLELQVQQLNRDAAARGEGETARTPQVLGCTESSELNPDSLCQPGRVAAAEYPKAKLTGFFQLDFGFYDQDAANRVTLGDIEDGLGFRRARLAAVGNVTENTSYVVEFDFAQAQARFVDVWMQFAETSLGNVRIGRFRQPYGMTELTGIRDLPFLERSLLFGSDVFFRQTGAMVTNSAVDDRLTWAVSGFRYLSDNFGNVYSDQGGYGVATRITCLPVDQGERLLHVGVDYSYKDPGRGIVQLANTNEFFAGQNPNFGVGGLSVLPLVGVPAFVDTGQISAQREQVFNVETALAFGRMLLQSEARWAIVEDDTGVVNTFPGVYAHLRYMLTGEVIPFNRSTAVFGRIKPSCPADARHGNWGAWEFAARVSHFDLNGTNLLGPGRRLTDTTIGLNWYVNNYTKFQFNWIHADLDDPTVGDSRADTFAFRGQLDF